MSSGSIARRYARALMAIGVDTNEYEALGRQIGDLAGTMKTSAELAQTLSNPVFPRSDRQKVLTALLARLKASKTVQSFVMLLLERERLAALPDISRELDAMIDERAGRVAAEVISARPLTDDQLAQLKGVLEKLSGKKVEIQKREDPELLGGVVAKVGDVVYDGSLRTQLAQMRHGLVG